MQHAATTTTSIYTYTAQQETLCWLDGSAGGRRGSGPPKGTVASRVCSLNDLSGGGQRSQWTTTRSLARLRVDEGGQAAAPVQPVQQASRVSIYTRGEASSVHPPPPEDTSPSISRGSAETSLPPVISIPPIQICHSHPPIESPKPQPIRRPSFFGYLQSAASSHDVHHRAVSPDVNVETRAGFGRREPGNYFPGANVNFTSSTSSSGSIALQRLSPPPRYPALRHTAFPPKRKPSLRRVSRDESGNMVMLGGKSRNVVPGNGTRTPWGVTLRKSKPELGTKKSAEHPLRVADDVRHDHSLPRPASPGFIPPASPRKSPKNVEDVRHGLDFQRPTSPSLVCPTTPKLLPRAEDVAHDLVSQKPTSPSFTRPPSLEQSPRDTEDVRHRLSFHGHTSSRFVRSTASRYGVGQALASESSDKALDKQILSLGQLSSPPASVIASPSIGIGPRTTKFGRTGGPVVVRSLPELSEDMRQHREFAGYEDFPEQNQPSLQHMKDHPTLRHEDVSTARQVSVHTPVAFDASMQPDELSAPGNLPQPFRLGVPDAGTPPPLPPRHHVAPSPRHEIVRPPPGSEKRLRQSNESESPGDSVKAVDERTQTASGPSMLGSCPSSRVTDQFIDSLPSPSSRLCGKALLASKPSGPARMRNETTGPGWSMYDQLNTMIGPDSIGSIDQLVAEHNAVLDYIIERLESSKPRLQRIRSLSQEFALQPPSSKKSPCLVAEPGQPSEGSILAPRDEGPEPEPKVEESSLLVIKHSQPSGVPTPLTTPGTPELEPEIEIIVGGPSPVQSPPKTDDLPSLSQTKNRSVPDLVKLIDRAVENFGLDLAHEELENEKIKLIKRVRTYEQESDWASPEEVNSCTRHEKHSDNMPEKAQKLGELEPIEAVTDGLEETSLECLHKILSEDRKTSPVQLRRGSSILETKCISQRRDSHFDSHPLPYASSRPSTSRCSPTPPPSPPIHEDYPVTLRRNILHTTLPIPASSHGSPLWETTSQERRSNFEQTPSGIEIASPNSQEPTSPFIPAPAVYFPYQHLQALSDSGQLECPSDIYKLSSEEFAGAYCPAFPEIQEERYPGTPIIKVPDSPPPPPPLVTAGLTPSLMREMPGGFFTPLVSPALDSSALAPVLSTPRPASPVISLQKQESMTPLKIESSPSPESERLPLKSSKSDVSTFSEGVRSPLWSLQPRKESKDWLRWLPMFQTSVPELKMEAELEPQRTPELVKRHSVPEGILSTGHDVEHGELGIEPESSMLEFLRAEDRALSPSLESEKEVLEPTTSDLSLISQPQEEHDRGMESEAEIDVPTPEYPSSVYSSPSSESELEPNYFKPLPLPPIKPKELQDQQSRQPLLAQEAMSDPVLERVQQARRELDQSEPEPQDLRHEHPSLTSRESPRLEHGLQHPVAGPEEARTHPPSSEGHSIPQIKINQEPAVPPNQPQARDFALFPRITAPLTAPQTIPRRPTLPRPSLMPSLSSHDHEGPTGSSLPPLSHGPVHAHIPPPPSHLQPAPLSSAPRSPPPPLRRKQTVGERIAALEAARRRRSSAGGEGAAFQGGPKEQINSLQWPFW